MIHIESKMKDILRIRKILERDLPFRNSKLRHMDRLASGGVDSLWQPKEDTMIFLEQNLLSRKVREA